MRLRHPGLPFRLRGRRRHGDGVPLPHPDDAAGKSAEANYDEVLSDAEAVFRAADAGNADARAVVREACQAVGAAIGGIANGLNPDVIVITGGIVKSLARYEDRILEHAAEYGFAATLADARIHFVPGYKTDVAARPRRTSARGERPRGRVSTNVVRQEDQPCQSVERDIPGAARGRRWQGGQEVREVCSSAHRSVVESHVTDDKLYCVYIAPSADLIREPDCEIRARWTHHCGG